MRRSTIEQEDVELFREMMTAIGHAAEIDDALRWGRHNMEKLLELPGEIWLREHSGEMKKGVKDESLVELSK